MFGTRDYREEMFGWNGMRRGRQYADMVESRREGCVRPTEFDCDERTIIIAGSGRSELLHWPIDHKSGSDLVCLSLTLCVSSSSETCVLTGDVSETLKWRAKYSTCCWCSMAR